MGQGAAPLSQPGLWGLEQTGPLPLWGLAQSSPAPLSLVLTLPSTHARVKMQGERVLTAFAGNSGQGVWEGRFLGGSRWSLGPGRVRPGSGGRGNLFSFSEQGQRGMGEAGVDGGPVGLGSGRAEVRNKEAQAATGPVVTEL